MVIKNKETVCVVLVTFNRKKLLLECLEVIKKQTRPVDAIYIIDNASQDGTPELLKSESYIPKLPPFNLTEPYEIEHQVRNLIDGNLIRIYYVRMHENTGGAGGFHEGIKRGYEKGYDWLWVMDDDGLPEINCLLYLFRGYEIVKTEGLIGSTFVAAPTVKNRENKNELAFDIPHRFLIEHNVILANGWGSFFNGVLIPKEVIKTVKYPLKEMFIWGDEVEYYKRIIKNGFNVLTFRNAILYHPKDRLKRYTKRIFGIGIYAGELDWKAQYAFMNNGYIAKTFGKYYGIKLIVANILAVFLIKDYSLRRLLFILKYYFKGLSKKFRNEN